GSTGGPLPLSRAAEYLRDGVLPGIGDQRTLTEVMRYSLAGRLTHRLIRDLADADPPDQLVSMVESPGLAERRYVGDDVELTFPSFVRTGLREAFTARDPAAARAMHGRLSRWYAARANGVDALLALQHAVAAQDWPYLHEVWVAHADDLVMSHPEQVLKILDAVPTTFLATHPAMLLRRAGLAVAASGSDSDLDGWAATLRTYSEASERIFTHGLDDLELPDLVQIGTWRMINLRMAGKLAEAEAFADEVEGRTATLIQRADGTPARTAWFHLQRGVTKTLLARHDDAAERYLRSWQEQPRPADYIL